MNFPNLILNPQLPSATMFFFSKLGCERCSKRWHAHCYPDTPGSLHVTCSPSQMFHNVRNTVSEVPTFLHKEWHAALPYWECSTRQPTMSELQLSELLSFAKRWHTALPYWVIPWQPACGTCHCHWLYSLIQVDDSTQCQNQWPDRFSPLSHVALGFILDRLSAQMTCSWPIFSLCF